MCAIVVEVWKVWPVMVVVSRWPDIEGMTKDNCLVIVSPVDVCHRPKHEV